MRWHQRLFRRAQTEKHLDAELRFHLEQQIADYVATGMTPEEARRRARLEFGGLDQVKEECRDVGAARFIETMIQDLRYGLRQLGKHRGFTAIAIITLSLGIGASTVVFSVVNGVLLSPLPFDHPSQLVAVYSRTRDFTQSSISYPNFLDWVRDNRSFSALAAYVADDFTLTGTGEPEHLPGERVSANFFPLLGVKAVIGRTFTAAEDQVGASPVVLISGGLWKRKFASSPDVLGKALTFDGKAYTVIGVIPSNFYYDGSGSQHSDLYLPIGQWNDPTFRSRKVSVGLDAVGRLKRGVSFEQAEADMDTVARRLAEEYPDADNGTGITLIPLKQSVVGDVQPYLLLLLAAVGFVLLIACVNVANLSLERSTVRTHEFGIRLTLGASRRRLIRQLLTESVLLGIAGGGLGLLVAFWGLQGALKALPAALPWAQGVRLDGDVLLFTLAVSLLAGILFGLVPALNTSTVSLHETLKEGGRGSTGTHHRTQSAFVIVEMALAVVLLAGAGLTIRSLAKLWSVSPGFDPHRVLEFSSSFPPLKSPDAVRAGWREIHDRLLAVPGVQAASLSVGAMPLGSVAALPFYVTGQPKPTSESQMKSSLIYLVQPDYLRVLKIPLVRGRFLTSSDTDHSPPVTVIDQDFARHYFPGQNPVGRRVSFDILNQTAEIVGVVGHVKQWGLNESAASPILAQCYFAVAQLPDKLVPGFDGYAVLVVRTTGSPLAVIGPIRSAMDQVDSRQVMYGIETMDGIISNSLSKQRFSMILMAVFACLALIMASIGIYGVVSYITSRRVHEIGVRIALGAQKRDVLRLVVRQGMFLALIGVGLGIVGALGLTRFLSSLLYGVKPTDPITFVAVSLILLGVALLACYIPARRAMTVDAMVALRHE